MSGQGNGGQQEQRKVLSVTTKSVVATARGYYGGQIRDPNGNDAERAPFTVPIDAKAKWFEPVRARRVAEDDIA